MTDDGVPQVRDVAEAWDKISSAAIASLQTLLSQVTHTPSAP